MLSKNHLLHVCQIGSGRDQCRYLESSDDKPFCLKLRPIASKIDAKINEKLKDRPNTQLAIGDNCQGYPVLLNILQGYDV